MVASAAISSEIQGSHTQYHAFNLQVRRAVGTDRDGKESYRLGSREGLHETPQDASRLDGDTVLRFARASQRTVPNDGDRGTVPRPASQRDHGAKVGRFRLPEFDPPGSTQHCSRSSGRSENRVLTRLRPTGP